MKRYFFAVGLIILCFVGFSFAQEKNPKVLKYVAPKYPPAAFATRTTGEVIVKIKIDKTGSVTAAEAESGHPFLKATAESFAKQWIFSAAETMEDREVKVTFAFFINPDEKMKNNYKDATYKIKFRKPYRLEIIATEYPRVNF